MTPAELLTYARQCYNADSDSIFSDAEGYKHIWAAQTELARETNCIENVYTTTTTASQQEYSLPSLAIAVKRITYAGVKLAPISFMQDDVLTLSNQSTTATGTPQYYAVWNRSIYLRPIPSATGTLKIWTYNAPDETVSGGAIDVPEAYHLMLSNYVLWRMAAKDQNYDAAEYWRTMWKEALADAKRHVKKQNRGDAFQQVVDEAQFPVTVIGAL